MSREIKFEYGFNSVNGIVKKKYYLHEIPFMHDKCDVWQMLPVLYVRQFTGLKDELQNDIYEGDILDFPFEIGIAYVINDGFRFAVKSPGSEAIDYEGEYVLQHTRIIGNIYENPELLFTPTDVL